MLVLKNLTLECFAFVFLALSSIGLAAAQNSEDSAKRAGPVMLPQPINANSIDLLPSDAKRPDDVFWTPETPPGSLAPGPEFSALGGSFHLKAFAPKTDGKFVAIGTYIHRSTNLAVTRLFVRLTKREKLQSLTDEPTSMERFAIGEIRWSPDETRIFYMVRTPGMGWGADFRDRRQALIMVDLASKMRTVISADAQAAQWSPDSRTLYFFQQEGDRKSSAPLHWRAYRAAGWDSAADASLTKAPVVAKVSSSPVTPSDNKLRITSVTDAHFDSPGAFTHDCSRFAVVVMTMTQTSGGYPENSTQIDIHDCVQNDDVASTLLQTVWITPQANQAGDDLWLAQASAVRESALQWSPDDHFLLWRAARHGVNATFAASYSVDVLTGRLMSIDDALSRGFAEYPREVVGSMVCEWMPGPGHRVLLQANRLPGFGGDTGPMLTEKELAKNKKWFVYDGERGTLQPVIGIDERGAPIYLSLDEGFSCLSWSPDGTMVSVGGYTSRVKAE